RVGVLADPLPVLIGRPPVPAGIYALALHDAFRSRHHWLGGPGRWRDSGMPGEPGNTAEGAFAGADPLEVTRSLVEIVRAERPQRSEEHTSELQSRENLVCRLLLEKKKHAILTARR